MSHMTIRRLHLLTLLLVAPSSARAQMNEIEWGAVEIVAQPVLDLPSPAGASMVYARDAWHVVFASGGEVRMSTRVDSTWGAPEPISGAGAIAREPHVASRPIYLVDHFEEPMVVVWEDARTGHAEVWARRHDGSTWAPETCLTCDADASRAPVVTTHGYSFVVAWEEQMPTRRAIQAREYRDGGWQAIETVSQSTADAFEPSLATEVFLGTNLAWSDTRHGAAEIYYRHKWDPEGSWRPEQRVTTSGLGSHHPSIIAFPCCGDIVGPEDWTIRFEQDVAGTPETREVSTYVPSTDLSPVDGTPSLQGSGGFIWVNNGWSNTIYADLVVWTDTPASGPRTSIVRSRPSGETLVLTTEGLSHALIDVHGHKVLTLWIESREGVPTLLARTAKPPFSGGVGGGSPLGRALEVQPNPARSGVTFVLREPAPRGTLRVFDAAGRRVHTQAAGGTSRLAWDLRDARGLRVPPGLYAAILEVGSQRERRTFVVLR